MFFPTNLNSDDLESCRMKSIQQGQADITQLDDADGDGLVRNPVIEHIRPFLPTESVLLRCNMTGRASGGWWIQTECDSLFQYNR